MSRDVITVGSTMRIPLLCRGEYSQWSERFMNYLEEPNDGEAMINSIKNSEQPLPVVAQVSLAGTAPNAPPTLKDPKFWTAEEKKTQKIDRDVNDAMGYKKKVVVVTSDSLALVAEKTKVSKRKEKVVVQSESEGSDDEDICDLKKITALLAKAFNRKKYHAKPTNNNLRTSSASSSSSAKLEEKKEDKKADEKKRDMSKVKCYNCKKEGHFAKYCKKAKVKDYNYYKTKMLLAKKDSDEQVLLAEDQA
ncbi:retrovirus-related pol polyprotein from transposon TNT 1-94 [Tanacetum coccineum]